METADTESEPETGACSLESANPKGSHFDIAPGRVWGSTVLGIRPSDPKSPEAIPESPSTVNLAALPRTRGAPCPGPSAPRVLVPGTGSPGQVGAGEARGSGPFEGPMERNSPTLPAQPGTRGNPKTRRRLQG